jgi:hypothetical protein
MRETKALKRKASAVAVTTPGNGRTEKEFDIVSMTPENGTRSWRDLVDQLTPTQIDWVESCNGRPAEDLLEAARRLASTRSEREDITAAVTAAMDGSGLHAESRSHYLYVTENMLATMGLLSLSTTELVALNALLVPAHSRFLRKARRDGRRRRGEPQ